MIYTHVLNRGVRRPTDMLRDPKVEGPFASGAQTSYTAKPHRPGCYAELYNQCWERKN